MRFIVSEDSQRLITGFNNESPITVPVEVKRRDTPFFDFAYVRPFVSYLDLNPAAEVLTFKLGAKALNDFSGDYLIFSDTFTKVTSGTETYYRIAPSLGSSQLDAAFVVGTITGETATATSREAIATEDLTVGDIYKQLDNGTYWIVVQGAGGLDWSRAPEHPYLDLSCELERVLNGGRTSTLTYTLRVNNDVNQGTEGAPSPAGPTYYTASEVTESFVSKTASDFDPDSGSVGSSRQLVDGVNNQTAMVAGDNTITINGAARKASLRSQLFGTVTVNFSTPDGTSYDCDISSLGLSATPSAVWCQISQVNSATPIAYSVELTSSTLIKLKFTSAPSVAFKAHLLIVP